jgi:hypothetical protein
MRDNDKSDEVWLKHKRTLVPRVSVMLRQSGISLEEKSIAEISAIETVAIDTYLASSRRRLDQITAHTWTALVLFGLFRNPGSDAAEKARARDVLSRLINPVHEEIDAGVANLLSRSLGKR